MGFLEFNILDILDILLVAFLLFQLYKLIKGTVAIRIFIGIVDISIEHFLYDGKEFQWDMKFQKKEKNWNSGIPQKI